MRAGESKRTLCPACGGNHCFSVSRQLGLTQYFCFRASCGCKGIINVNATSDELREKLYAKDEMPKEDPLFDIPSTWIMPNTRTHDFLNKWNVLHALRRMHMRYDVKEDRHVFLIMDNGGCYGAIGRSATPHAIPKTKNYHKTFSRPFIVGEGDVLVIVEDCLSAAAVSHYTASLALAGTDIKPSYIPYILAYKHVIIALDRDAAVKSLKLSERLRQYMTCSTSLLPKDVKNMSLLEREMWWKTI